MNDEKVVEALSVSPEKTPSELHMVVADRILSFRKGDTTTFAITENTGAITGTVLGWKIDGQAIQLIVANPEKALTVLWPMHMIQTAWVVAT